MAKSSKTTAAVSVVTENNQALSGKIDQAQLQKDLNALRGRLEALKGPSNKEISLDIDFETQTGAKLKISNIKTVTELLNVQTSVTVQSTAFEAAAALHSLTGKVKPWANNGKTAEQWQEIIGKAITAVANKAAIEKLEAHITKLSEFLDQETKKALAYAEIQKDYNGLLD